MLNHHTIDSLTSLAAALTRYVEAGIDPTFDCEVEELERQFAEIRLTFGHN
jgi:hypothetical protein